MNLESALLTVITTIEIFTPSLSLVLLITFRFYILATMSVPGFIHKLNGQFLPEHFELSGITGGLIYVCLFLLYPTGKFIMGIKFWRISQEGNRFEKIDSTKWTLGTILVTLIGILLIFPMRAEGVPEIGMCVILLTVNTLVSLCSSIFIFSSLHLLKSQERAPTQRGRFTEISELALIDTRI